MRRTIGCLAALPLLALAQQDDSVVVSATRVEQPSLELPVSIDRVHAEEIREGRAQVNLSESLGRVPGIVVQNRQNYAQDLQVSSRGFGARATFGVRGIRLIADGIPATMPDGQGQAATFALGSAQRIEVMRGPFSSLYGNAAGGVINVITEDGPPEPQAEAGLWAGSYGSSRIGLKLGGQAGAFNVLAEGSRFDTDGYRRHSAATRDHANGKLKYAWSDRDTLTVVVNSLRQPETQDPLGLTRAQFDANPRQAIANAFTFNTRKSIFQDQAGATYQHRFRAGGRLQAALYAGDRYVEQYLAIPLATQGLATHSGGVVNLDRGYRGGSLRFSDEGLLLENPFKASLGIEIEKMAERRRGFINANGFAGALKRDEDDVVSSTGAYAQGEWRFAERWSAHAGLRTSRVRFRSSDYFVVAGNGDDGGERTYTATTPVAGLVFRLDPRTTLYANLGRGFETPTFAELANRIGGSGVNFGLQAARSRHFEVGAKAVLPGIARVNLALFEAGTRDEIVIESNSGGRATFKNAGRTTRSGIELGAESMLQGGFEAALAYTYLRAAFRDSFGTVTGTPGVPVTVAAGNLLPGVPRSQLYAELRWRHAPSGFSAAIEALRKSRVAVNEQNSQFADAYGTVNLVAGFAQQGAGWKVAEFVRVDNATDRNYVGSVIVNDGNGRFYEPAPRRSILLGMQANLQF